MKLLKKTTLICTNTMVSSAITLDIDNATCDVNVIGEQKPINRTLLS